MEACTLPMTVKLPKYINEREFAGCNLNPVVVLTDCRKSSKKTAEKRPLHIETPPTSPESEDNEKRSAPGGPVKGKIRSEGSPAPPRSNLSQPSPGKLKPAKRKRDSDEVEYEIEEVMGYHRDKKGVMWYLIKWMGWSNEFNTFEPIANLTGCNYKLMMYFETKPPTKAALREKNDEIWKLVTSSTLYRKLSRNKCTAEDIEEILCDLPQKWTRLFVTTNLNRFEKRVEKEYQYIVRCLIGMNQHQDAMLALRGRNYRLLLMLIRQRRKQLANLAAVEKLINEREKTEITIVNEVDLDEFPDLEYIVDMKRGEGIFYSEEPLLGCECRSCNAKSWCCGRMSDSQFAYGPLGKLRIPHRTAIYECNSRCLCPPTCRNRVVQHGRQVKLCIFKTKSCGWGVRATENIPKGTFVCEYLGELISNSEADARDVVYTTQKSAYTFDLDFFEDSAADMYCIDATEYGNVARFINHSCDPNLVVYPVFVECLAPNMHRLAFFARRNIQEGEEIHIDYENLSASAEADEDDNGKTYSMRKAQDVRCQCNSPNCRKWVFGTK